MMAARVFLIAPMHAAGQVVLTLRIVHSEYRSVVAPLLRVIEEGEVDRPVIVVVPELAEGQ